jgi:hypothetical protein
MKRLNESRRNPNGSSDESSEPSDGDECMEDLDRRGVIEMEWGKTRELMERATKLDAETD